MAYFCLYKAPFLWKWWNHHFFGMEGTWKWWILVDFVIFWVKHLRLFWYVGYWYVVAFSGEIQPVSNGPPVLILIQRPWEKVPKSGSCLPIEGKTPDLVPESERKNAGHFHQKWYLLDIFGWRQGWNRWIPTSSVNVSTSHGCLPGMAILRRLHGRRAFWTEICPLAARPLTSLDPPFGIFVAVQPIILVHNFEFLWFNWVNCVNWVSLEVSYL